MQHRQHVIDWYRMRGYRVTELTDGALMCVSEAADAAHVAYAIHQLHTAKWKKS